MSTTTLRRWTGAWTALSVFILLTLAGPSSPPAAGSVRSSERADAGAARGPYATLLFSRTEVTAADGCVADDAGIARLDSVVAPFLDSLGLSATGTLVTDETKPVKLTCTHSRSSMSASWAQARSLADHHGWSFTSHTATYPGDLSRLTPAQSRAETCGSARTLDQHGLPGGHGLISYPGAQPLPVALQTGYASRCFAWGRDYGALGITHSLAGRTSPYWQHTYAANGGACHDSDAPCYSISATGSGRSGRYRLPGRLLDIVNSLGRREWFTLQAYVLVTGRSPSYSTSRIRWDCTSPDPRLHWANDNERYCFRDWRTVVEGLHADSAIEVTDPLSVGIAFGRPATYP